MQPKSLDHVAFWTDRRAEIAATLVDRLGVHEIDKQDTFTLLGTDARRFKITLFDAEGPRDPGPFVHIALRMKRLPDGPFAFTAGDGLRVLVIEDSGANDFDLDHVALLTADPALTAAELERFGFAPAGPGRVEVAGSYVELQPGLALETDRPLLNHVAVLVDSAADVVADADELGIEVESMVDAPNTYAAFLVGPDGVRIEYVEHKPTFALR